MKYKFITEVVDTETGEIIPLDNLGNDVSQVDFDESVERIVMLKELYNTVNNIYRCNEAKFLQNMDKIEAKKFVNNEVEIKLNTQSDYEYSNECILKLKELLPEHDFNNIFTEKFKVNRTFLKGALAYGGEIKKLIEDMQTKIDRKPTILITKR